MGIAKAIQGEYDKAIEIFKDGVKLRTELKDEIGIANSNNNIALIYSDLGQNEKAISQFKKSLIIYEKKSNYKGMMSVLANIGICYHNMGDYRQAIDYYSRGLKWSEKKKDKKLIATTLSNIAVIHFEQKEFDLALKEFERCKKLYKEIGNDYELASILGYIGSVYQSKGELDKALNYYEEGLELKKKINDVAGVGILYSNIGTVYKEKKQYTKALEYYELGLINNEAGGMLQQIAGCYNNMGNINLTLDNIDKAKFYSEKAYAIADENSYAAELSASAELLWKIFKKLGNESKALEMFEKFITTRDTLQSKENQKAIMQQQFQYQYEIQAAEDSLQNAEKEKVQSAQINQQKAEIKAKQNLQFALFFGLGLVFVFSVFIYNRFRLTQKQNKIIEEQKHIVEEKNKEVLDSIKYAKRIQQAILPSRQSLNENLKNGFVLYKPKDIVAGDFYWFEKHENLVFIAAADCTGHGVPGAMVSVICSNALSKALLEEGITDTGKLLDRTRELVVERFSKSEENVQDGMDISLVSLAYGAKNENENGMKIHWSGANNPLWIIRPSASSGTNELIEYKPNKQPIGNYADPKPFTVHEIEIFKGDTFYIFTDGFQDQFGGDKGKKFKAAKLKELLLSIQNEKMDEQKNIIDAKFEKWRGDLEQNDDVCIIGVKI